MRHTLDVYNNLQYNPIEIDDFCIVEVYKDAIAETNVLGYYIQPLKGVDPSKIKETIENGVLRRVDSYPKGSGYTDLVILAGRDFDSYSRRIIYAVWYNAETQEVPQLPDEPEITDLGATTVPFELNQPKIIFNGSAPSYATITLTLDRLDLPVEFWINDDYFKIDVSQQIPVSDKILTIDKSGVKYNSVPINSYEFLSVPKLKTGVNVIKVNRLMIRHVKVQYIRKY